MKEYSDEELDYVIDKLDFGFMRNRIKRSPEDTKWMMGSFAGAIARMQYRLHKMTQEIIGRE